MLGLADGNGISVVISHGRSQCSGSSGSSDDLLPSTQELTVRARQAVLWLRRPCPTAGKRSHRLEDLRQIGAATNYARRELRHDKAARNMAAVACVGSIPVGSTI